MPESFMTQMNSHIRVDFIGRLPLNSKSKSFISSKLNQILTNEILMLMVKISKIIAHGDKKF